MPKETNLEFKVGLFVLLALIGLTVLIFSISDFSAFAKGKNIKVVYEFANGLKKNAPVRIAGVDEGVVKEIKLFFDRQDSKIKAEVLIWVNENTKIPVDSSLTINQLGLLGEKYVEILPGIDTKEFLKEGDLILGKNPTPQEEISERIMEVAGRIEETIAGLNIILHSEDNQLSISDTLKNLSSMTGNMDDILLSMKDGRGTMGRLLSDSMLYDNLQEMTADLKENPWKLLYRPRGAIKK